MTKTQRQVPAIRLENCGDSAVLDFRTVSGLEQRLVKLVKLRNGLRIFVEASGSKLVS